MKSEWTAVQLRRLELLLKSDKEAFTFLPDLPFNDVVTAGILIQILSPAGRLCQHAGHASKPSLSLFPSPPSVKLFWLRFLRLRLCLVHRNSSGYGFEQIIEEDKTLNTGQGNVGNSSSEWLGFCFEFPCIFKESKRTARVYGERKLYWFSGSLYEIVLVDWV